jgi:AsnC family.
MCVKVDENVYTTSVARRIMAVRGVQGVGEVTGDFDIVARVSAENAEELNRIIEEVRAVRGVKSTLTNIVLKQLSAVLRLGAGGPQGPGTV